MSTIRPVQQSDWAHFCSLALAEGWRVPDSELKLFQTDWSHCVQVMETDGFFAGLVTAVAHQRSGWIGNLLVPVELRGRRFGARLFQAALDDLAHRGVTSCWLTASELGQPIYEQFGFVEVNQVERWVLKQQISSGCVADRSADAGVQLRALDSRAWGETRSSLLEALSWQGKTYCCDDTTALLQSGTDLQIIGPWYSESCCPRTNQQLLQVMLSVAEPEIEVVIDMIASSPLRSLMAASGFELSGNTVLMARGNFQEVDLKKMVSLASLGSFG